MKSQEVAKLRASGLSTDRAAVGIASKLGSHCFACSMSRPTEEDYFLTPWAGGGKSIPDGYFFPPGRTRT